MLRRLAPLAALLALTAGCATEYHDDGHGHDYDDHLDDSQARDIDLKASGTVYDVIRARGCSTGPLAALDNQIATELACLAPDTMKRIDTIPGVTLGAGARTFMQADAADALRRAARELGGIGINSGWRSVAQQHVLKSWEGSCGIGIAATPGNSNHQSGLAIDTSNWSSARGALKRAGFSWYCDYRNGGSSSGCNDVVHFDYFAGDDLRPLAVLAFQKLWNRNNPNDRIAEDGSWGPQTASRVSRAPLQGFTRTATCAAAGNEPPPPPPEPEAPACGTYTDVPADHTGYPAIEATTDAGYFSGCGADRFCPDDAMNRATTAALLARVLALPQSAHQGYFTDVPASLWAAPAIEALYREGIIAGCAADRFCPDDKTTRVQTIVMLARAFNVDPISPTGTFEDVPTTHWAAPFVEAMKAAGHTSGCTATRFCPDADLPRYQMAMLLARITHLALPPRCE